MDCATYDLALIFLLLRFKRLTLFFLHFALILTVGDVLISTGRREGVVVVEGHLHVTSEMSDCVGDEGRKRMLFREGKLT